MATSPQESPALNAPAAHSVTASGSAPRSASGGDARINPASLAVAELARLLSTAGGRAVTPEQIDADIDAGAPASLGADGAPRLNLVHYAAWLLRDVT